MMGNKKVGYDSTLSHIGSSIMTVKLEDQLRGAIRLKH
jgi:hypothetical protein